MDKSQRPRLTFDLELGRSYRISISVLNYFSETIGQIELKFHVKNI